MIQKFNEELERRIREATAELAEKNANLETMLTGFVWQENHMIAVNKNVSALEAEIGELKKTHE